MTCAGVEYFTHRARGNAASKATLHAESVQRAGKARRRGDTAARPIEEIRIDLAQTGVPAGHRVLALDIAGTRLEITGPERVRLSGGDNGSGKSTLLAWALGAMEPGRPDEYPAPVLGPVTVLVAMQDPSSLSGGERVRVALAQALASYRGALPRSPMTSISRGACACRGSGTCRPRSRASGSAST